MANLVRKLQKIFGESSGDNGVFGSTKTGTPVYNSDIAAIQSAAFLQGWTGAVDSVPGGYKRPVLAEMNGCFKVFSEQLAYILQKGIPEYDTLTEYFVGDLVRSAATGLIYKSITNSNTGNAVTSIANWEFQGSLDQLLQGRLLGASTGTSTVYALTPAIPYTVYPSEFFFFWEPHITNGAAPTLNINGLGALTVEYFLSTGLTAAVPTGSLQVGRKYLTYKTGTKAVIFDLQAKASQGDVDGKIDDVNFVTPLTLENTPKGIHYSLLTRVINNEANVNITAGINSTFKNYRIILSDITFATNQTALQLLVSENGGASFAASGYQWDITGTTTAAVPLAGNNNAATSILLTSTNGAAGSGSRTSNAALATLSGEINIYSPSVSNRNKLFEAHLTYVTSTGATALVQAGGAYTLTLNPIDALRLSALAGNLLGGTIELIGIK